MSEIGFVVSTGQFEHKDLMDEESYNSNQSLSQKKNVNVAAKIEVAGATVESSMRMDAFHGIGKFRPENSTNTGGHHRDLHHVQKTPTPRQHGSEPQHSMLDSGYQNL